MDLEKIKKNILGELYYFDSIDSTNSAALKCEDAPDGSLFLAESRQTEEGVWEGTGRQLTAEFI